MDYQLTIDPSLGVSAEEFADAWNETPTCRTLAEAQTFTLSPKAPLPDPQLIQQGLVLLSGAAGAAGALALDALKDAVKGKLTDYFKEKLSHKPSLKVEAVRQPDGAYLIVVTEES